jgi:hypothetical protein
MSKATHRRIGSPGSGGGPSLFDSLDGETTAQSGRVPVPVSRSPSPEAARPKPTSDTSGPSSDASSRTRALQSALESRLRARLAVDGSPEYELTWKTWDMESGPQICALRASARRTSDNDSGGWPTPAAQNADGGPNPAGNTGEHFTLQTAAELTGWPTPNIPNRGTESREAKDKRGSGGIDLQTTALMSGWPTTTATDAERCEAVTPVKNALNLNGAVSLVGWATPNVPNGDRTSNTTNYRPDGSKRQVDLGAQATLCLDFGEPSESSTAETEKPVVYRLNPAFSCWLMGFGIEWLMCMQNSLRKH